MTDRELDALVAEKVFGHDLIECPECWDINDPPDVDSIGCSAGHSSLTKHRRGMSWHTSPRFYSTTIEAAWLVVEAMRGKGIYFDSDFDPSGRGHKLAGRDTPDVWGVNFWTEDDGQIGGAHAATMPRAICLAALRALGVESI